MKICWICGNDNLSRLDSLIGYHYCQNCKVLRIKKVPKVHYGKSYYKGTFSFLSLLFIPIFYFFCQLRSSYIKLKQISCWIDVGAGEGGYLKSVQAKKKIGVEISEAGRNIIESSGLEAMNSNEFLNAKLLNANIVSFWHVLEHVENPWEYLKAANRNLLKGGEIVVGVPNVDSLEFSIFKKFWFHLAPRYHIWHFSPKSMRILLKQNGFKVRSIDYWAIEHHLTGIIQSFLNRTTNTSNILHLLVKRGTKIPTISMAVAGWILFWFTLGLPIVIFFWITQALLKKSGAIVIIAHKIK